MYLASCNASLSGALLSGNQGAKGGALYAGLSVVDRNRPGAYGRTMAGCTVQSNRWVPPQGGGAGARWLGGQGINQSRAEDAFHKEFEIK